MESINSSWSKKTPSNTNAQYYTYCTLYFETII